MSNTYQTQTKQATVVLPDMGDGITSGVVVAIHAQAGKQIAEGETIVEVETDKAVLPVPAPQSLTVEKPVVNEGDEVKVGDALLTFVADNSGGEVSVSDNSTKMEKNAPRETASKAQATASTTSSSTLPKTFPLIVGQLGDGIDSGIVVSIAMANGKKVAEGETLFEIETDKAVLPYPSPHSGTIVSVNLAEGDTLKPGDTFAEMQADADSSAENTELQTEKTSVSVDELPETKKAREPVSERKSEELQEITIYSHIAAGPAVRKLARELGVNLSKVKGSRRGGRIDIADLKLHVKNVLIDANASVATGKNAYFTPPPLPDFSEFGEIEEEKLPNLRMTIARNMEISSRIPHVHQNIDVDISKILKWQLDSGAAFKERGGALSVTLFVIKAICSCLKQFPRFNSSIDMAKGTLVLKKYCNIGVAVDTPAGLIVPVIKAADRMDIFELGVALRGIAKKARERKVMPSDLKGASITVSNLGGLGAGNFTPIINSPEVAIVGVSRTKTDLALVDGQVVEKHLLPLVLGYDHRVIDGADAARFVVVLKKMLENPENLLMGLPSFQ